jgi:hypothetical protein
MTVKSNKPVIADASSNCCGAEIWEPDFCSDCKEHCAAELNDIYEAFQNINYAQKEANK